MKALCLMVFSLFLSFFGYAQSEDVRREPISGQYICDNNSVYEFTPRGLGVYTLLKSDSPDDDVLEINVDISIGSTGKGTVIDIKNSTDIGSIKFFGRAFVMKSLLGDVLCIEFKK